MAAQWGKFLSIFDENAIDIIHILINECRGSGKGEGVAAKYTLIKILADSDYY